MRLYSTAVFLSIVPVIVAGTTQAHAQHMNAADAPCRNAVITSDMTSCFFDALKKSDADLNQLYQRVQLVVEDDELTKLKAAQRLWIQFRDTNCEAEYALYAGGTAAPVVRLACLEATTRHREEELKVMYGGRQEKREK